MMMFCVKAVSSTNYSVSFKLMLLHMRPKINLSEIHRFRNKTHLSSSSL